MIYVNVNVNLSNKKHNSAWFFILAYLLDKGMQPFNYNVKIG